MILKNDTIVVKQDIMHRARNKERKRGKTWLQRYPRFILNTTKAKFVSDLCIFTRIRIHARRRMTDEVMRIKTNDIDHVISYLQFIDNRMQKRTACINDRLVICYFKTFTKYTFMYMGILS